MNDFPAHPDEITAQWLTKMLRDAGDLDDGGEVVGFETAVIGEGISLLGLVVRVALDYSGAGAGAPDTVVIKFATPVEVNRAVAMNTNMYGREIDFFGNIAPQVEMPLPRCYFAAIDPATGDNAVVLEDLKAYRAGDQILGIDADEAKAIIDSFTPLTAAFWGRTDQPLLADTMRIDSSYVDAFVPSVDMTWERCLELFPEAMTPEVREAVPRFVASLRDLHRMMGERTQTLIHGDVRLDNVMFAQQADQHPIVLIDWQAIMISNPMQDLAYMLSQSMDTEIRRQSEEELIAYYRDALTASGVEGYTLEQARDDYDVAVLWIMAYPIIIGGFCDTDQERSVALAELVLQRSSQTITDRNLLARLP
jgi:hypothetical protein